MRCRCFIEMKQYVDPDPTATPLLSCSPLDNEVERSIGGCHRVNTVSIKPYAVHGPCRAGSLIVV